MTLCYAEFAATLAAEDGGDHFGCAHRAETCRQRDFKERMEGQRGPIALSLPELWKRLPKILEFAGKALSGMCVVDAQRILSCRDAIFARGNQVKPCAHRSGA
jgi:hypothetical protein